MLVSYQKWGEKSDIDTLVNSRQSYSHPERLKDYVSILHKYISSAKLEGTVMQYKHELVANTLLVLRK